MALAAGYDTTAHTLAFALWELAARPELNDPAIDRRRGARGPAALSGGLDRQPGRTARPVEVDGGRIPAGRMVLYSPYLTHRDPDLWPRPAAFRPERFDGPLPAWGYLPFGAGERSCLGAALATAMLEAAVRGFAARHPASGRRRPAPGRRGDADAPRPAAP